MKAIQLPVVCMVVLFIVLSACKNSKEKTPVTREEKAQAAIKELMKKNLPHPESYQAISFSTLDSTFTEPNLDSAGYYQQLAEYYVVKAEEVLPSDFKKSAMYSDSSLYFSERLKNVVRNQKREFNGYKMTHDYQATEAANLMTKNKITVYFDTSLAIIKFE